MTDEANRRHRTLRKDEVSQLRSQGCRATDWSSVRVTEPFLADRVVDVEFAGDIRIGSLDGECQNDGFRSKAAGLYHAQVADCVLGDGVRIASVAERLAGYHVGARVTIENVGLMETRPGASFGAGVNVEALNEAGGREVPLFNEITSQFAYLVCLHRYRRQLIDRLLEMARTVAEANKRDYGTIGEGARVAGTSRIADIDVGPHATIDSAQSLANGTILSCAEAPTVIQEGVIAKDFIVAEGSIVSGGAMLEKTFVGQGCRIGKQFSAENCLFFANCEAFHGEACAAFAGPYTVTHHKSTLLIGGLFSFFNAGSATNQSNHRYKLGPAHEGKLERGCKTGSSSYLMWPCRVGPFSVVLGKHTRHFDAADLPFSHLEADSAGRCVLIPGHYIATVGTLRDGAKWPRRDRRKAAIQRDFVCFDVFNPLTVARMTCGKRLLAQLLESTNRAVDSVTVGGVVIKRVLLRTGQKRYSAAAQRYLFEQIVNRVEHRLENSGRPLQDVLAADRQAIYSERWVDVGGQLMPEERLRRLCESVLAGEIATVGQLQQAFGNIRNQYDEDVWLWVRKHAADVALLDLDVASTEQIQQAVTRFCELQQSFLRLVLVDAGREFDEASQTGFGIDGEASSAASDFVAVRGQFTENSFVQGITAEIEQLPARCQRVCDALACTS